MSKQKFILFFAFGLLLINLGLIAFIVLRKPPHPNHLGSRNEIIAKLNFSKSQVVAYDELIHWHRKEIVKTERKIKQVKNKLYHHLVEDSTAQENDLLIDSLGKLQVQIEKIHFQHFQEIGKLCTNNQKAKFKKLSSEISGIFFDRGPKHKRP